MHYTIITIDDSRADVKANIREAVTLPEVTSIGFCDARVGNNMRAIEWTSLWGLTRAEIAIWHSHMNCWEWAARNGPLLVLEDDAIVDHTFMEHFNHVTQNLPEGWDYVSLWVPPNQEQDFMYDTVYDHEGTPTHFGRAPSEWESQYFIPGNVLAHVYQGYGFVATLYSQEGARKLLQIALERGIYTTADCFIFLQAHAGNVNGYAPKPDYTRFIWHDFDRPSLKGI